MTAVRPSELNLNVSAVQFGWSNSATFLNIAAGKIKAATRALCKRKVSCAETAKACTRARREKESFLRRVLVIKVSRIAKRTSASFRLFPHGSTSDQWQNWILVKASSRFVDRQRHFCPCRPATRIPFFLPANLNYISLRTFVIAMARY